MKGNNFSFVLFLGFVSGMISCSAGKKDGQGVSDIINPEIEINQVNDGKDSSNIVGKVKLLISIDEIGSITNIEISQSSGNLKFDNSAIDNAKSKKFKPLVVD